MTREEFILKLSKIVFRRKRTLIGLLFIITGAIVREITAINTSEFSEQIINEAIGNYGTYLIKLIYWIINCFTAGGSYLILAILVFLFILIFILKLVELRYSRTNNTNLCSIKNRVVQQIIKLEKIKSSDYSELIDHIKNEKITKALFEYYHFKRTRGSIEELETIVTQNNLANLLNKLEL